MAELRLMPLCDAKPPLGALFAATACAEGSAEWFRVLAETTLAPGEQAQAAVLIEDGAPVAALPLAVGNHGARGLTAPYTTCFAPAFANAATARELGRRARGFVPGVLRLQGCDPEQPGMAAFLDGLQEGGLAVARFGNFANWHETVSDFESWWAARPSRLKSTVRRKRKAAERAGVEFADMNENFEQAIAVYEDIYRASWKEAEPHPAFMACLIRRLGGAGMLRMGIMSMAGRAVAAQVWLVGGGRGTIFKLAHREDAAAYSPGTLLTHWMTEKLVRADGLRELDFGRGDDAYKKDWLAERRMRMGVIAADWRTAAGLGVTMRDIIPTLGARAFRKQFGGNRPASAAIGRGPVLSAFGAQRYIRLSNAG